MKPIHVFLVAVLVSTQVNPVQAAPPETIPGELRQTIYRVPMLEGAALFAGAKRSDAEILQQIQAWVAAGKAEVRSDMATTLVPGETAILTDGKKIWLPTERDQDFDKLFLATTSSDAKPVGASLQVHDSLSTGDYLGWKADYTERAPLLVPWPASWLEQKKAIHGWVDWYDTFVEQVITSCKPSLGAPAILGVIPSATHAWDHTKSTKPVQMDVIVAEADHARPATDKDTRQPCTMLTGIVIASNRALLLTQYRKPELDPGLFETLLADTATGKAKLAFFVAASYQNGQRLTLQSGRLHEYPTEMPSIPSAWDQRLVGTRAECDIVGSMDMNLSLEHHVSPPRRLVWPLSLKEPELIMWEPAFRRFELSTGIVLAPNSVRLAGIGKVPPAMAGEGLQGAETLLVFAHISGELNGKVRSANIPIDPFAPPEANAPKVADATAERPLPNVHAHLHVFEVPNAEAAKWQQAPKNEFAAPDTQRFKDIFNRALTGGTTLVGHELVVTRSGFRATASMVEEVMSATEFDPPTKEGPHRMRPTALEMLPTGTQMEVDVAAGAAPGPDEEIVDINFNIVQAVAAPIEPELGVAIKSVGLSGMGPSPKAAQFEAAWRGSLKFFSGEPQCLGTQEVVVGKGKTKKTKTLVAFLTATREDHAQP